MKKLMFFENLNLLRNNDKMSFEPTYEGLKHIFVYFFKFGFVWVLSLPMRDWNLCDRLVKHFSIEGFEPTYEGLKHNFINLISFRFIFVLSLPMRDWNKCIEAWLILRYSERFWAYLWGIETLKKSRKKLFKKKSGFWAYLWGIETNPKIYCHL